MDTEIYYNKDTNITAVDTANPFLVKHILTHGDWRVLVKAIEQDGTISRVKAQADGFRCEVF